ncbi:MAG: dUTP diphosphatase [Leptospiraceae bacterium]|nr:dUTP diphosphatase [Leptospiraceae bacterium]MCB1314596.1 dUTP diphosphatase [Leptospiraceae bacterium]MCB1321839.1 dUTP diphosphatase [Leptospiraceae bacterium]
MASLPHVRIYRRPGAKLPVRATPGSAALDVHACLPPDTFITITPGDYLDIPTGLFVEIPEGFMLSLRPRSGLALKHCVTLPNAPATIDSDYRGEIRVILVNHGKKPFRIDHGDRIAQMLLEKVIDFAWDESETPIDPDSTPRGAGGFGSTGLA